MRAGTIARTPVESSADSSTFSPTLLPNLMIHTGYSPLFLKFLRQLLCASERCGPSSEYLSLHSCSGSSGQNAHQIRVTTRCSSGEYYTRLSDRSRHLFGFSHPPDSPEAGCQLCSRNTTGSDAKSVAISLRSARRPHCLELFILNIVERLLPVIEIERWCGRWFGFPEFPYIGFERS